MHGHGNTEATTKKRKKNKTNQSMVNEHKYKETQWYDFHYTEASIHQITSHRCSVKLWLSANWTNGLYHVCAKLNGACFSCLHHLKPEILQLM